MSKQCSECGLTKDVSDFYKNSASQDGLRANCKACHNGKRFSIGTVGMVGTFADIPQEPAPPSLDTPLTEYKFRYNGEMVKEIGECDVCNQYGVLFKSFMVSNTDVATLELCNYCTRQSQQGEILYARIQNKLAAITYIDR